MWTSAVNALAGLTLILSTGAVSAATGTQPAASIVLKRPVMVAQSCPYYVVLGCFDSYSRAERRNAQIGGRIVDTSEVDGFNPGYYCIVDGPHNSRGRAESLRESWLDTVPDAYVKAGCE